MARVLRNPRRWNVRRASARIRCRRAYGFGRCSGGLALVALVLALRLANRFIALPRQTFPRLEGVSQATVVAIAAPAAGIIEESAFRGYMQDLSNEALA